MAKRGPKPGTTWKQGATSREAFYNAMHGVFRAIAAREMYVEQIIDRGSLRTSATFARVNKETLPPKVNQWRSFMRAQFEEWQRKQRLRRQITL